MTGPISGKQLSDDELLITSFGATRLRMEMDRIPLWRGDHVAAIRDFRYVSYITREIEMVTFDSFDANL